MAAGTIYPNIVIENRIDNALNTSLATRTLMKIDSELQGTDGMTKKIKKYTYTGTAEAVAKGETADAGAVAYVDANYTIARVQAKFAYYDDDAMEDSKYVETGIDGMPKSMINYANDQFFGELAKIGYGVDTSAFTYDAIVDAIADMDVEDENGLFILGGNDFKKAIRKDADFKAANQGEILFTGQIGSIVGKPIIISKKVPAGIVSVITREAITCFIKKDTFVEQDHNINTKLNTIVADNYLIVALTNDTKARKVILPTAVTAIKALSVVKDAALPTEIEVTLADTSKVKIPAVYKTAYSTAVAGVITGTKVVIGGVDKDIVITVVEV